MMIKDRRFDGYGLTWYKQKYTQLFRQIGSEMDEFYKKHGADTHIDTRHIEIAGLCKGPKVLDVGCGTGDLLLILQDMHPEWKLHGTDISMIALEMARERGVKAELSCQEDMPTDHMFMETVVLSQVLEHMHADAGHWLMMRAALVASRLIVSVPDGDKVPSVYHLRTFNPEELLEELSVYGEARLHEWSGGDRRLIVVVDHVEG